MVARRGSVVAACSYRRRVPIVSVGVLVRAQILATVLALGLLLVSPAVAAPVRVGSAPRRPAGSRLVGTVASSTRIGITVTLRPRDPAALASYATEVSTPGAGVYRHYLSVAEFRRRFAPTTAQLNAIEASLAAHGLAAGAVSANGLAIPVTATAGALGRAFSLSFQRVALAGGRTAFANNQAPRFAASLASLIQGVVGLNDLSQARPLGLVANSLVAHPAPLALAPATAKGLALSAPVATGGPQPCQDATSTASADDAHTADQLASAYGFSSLYGAGDLGAGQTIALFEVEPYADTDIAAYQSCYATDTSVAGVAVDGGPSGTDAGSGEAALDIEDVIGLAPRAKILVYDAPNDSQGIYDDYDAIVSADVASVISTSWGECEPAEGPTAAEAENTLFEEAAAQGQTVFAAAGDAGSEDCDGAGVGLDTSLEVDDPASQPFVTGVGGTSISALGPPPVQTVWNDECGSGPCGGGGGVSSLWTMPSYQSTAPASLNVINSNSSGSPCRAPAGSYCREVPDVSADADPAGGYLIYYDGGWTGIGGTSAAAPLWAAFAGLANASSRCGGSPIGFANPALYEAAASGYASDFDDVTVGDNDILSANNGLYPAGPGYDMASGLGSPNGSALATALCGGGLSTPRSTAVSVTCSPSMVAPGGATTCTATVSDTAPGAVHRPDGTVSFTATPAGAGSFAGGGSCALISVGTGAGACQISYRPSATGAQAIGAGYSGDDVHAASSSSTFTLTVSAPPAAAAPAPISSPSSGRTYVVGPSAPTNLAVPVVRGTAKAGSTLSCSDGRWTSSPTSYAYRWRRDGVALAGAVDPTYRVQTEDEGTTLRCTVSATNAAGTRGPAISQAVRVPVPVVARCPAAKGSLAGSTLGSTELGMTRTEARAAYLSSSVRSSADVFFFCLTPIGIRVAFPSPGLLSSLSSGQRDQFDDRVIWASSANPHYAIDGVRPGATLAAAEHALPHGNLLAIGDDKWYVAPAGRATAVLGIRAGLVQQVGIAERQLTPTRRAQVKLLASYYS